MKKLYLVALGAQQNREDSIRRLVADGRNGPWFYSMPNTFCIYSQLRAQDLFNRLHNPMDPQENLMVTEVPADNSCAWLPRQHCDLIAANSVVHDYNLRFDGYWTDANRDSLPRCAGVYCVYLCEQQPDRTLKLLDLLYIGRAEDIHARHQNHERHADWLRFVAPGQTLCYSCAPVPKPSLPICEGALIFRHKPRCNDSSKDGFYHATTHVLTSDCNRYLASDFTVTRTEA